MAIKKKVIDASVAVKWFLQEESSEKALELLEEHTNGIGILVVPEFCFLEVVNVLRYKKKDIADLARINKDMWNIQLHVEKVDAFLLEKACILALKYDLTVYDALYLAIAQLYGTYLITADKKLAGQPSAILIERI